MPWWLLLYAVLICDKEIFKTAWIKMMSQAPKCLARFLIGKSYETKNLCTARNKENVAAQLVSARKMCASFRILYIARVSKRTFLFCDTNWGNQKPLEPNIPGA